MSVLSNAQGQPAQGRPSLLNAISQWLRNWTRSRAESWEMQCCGAEDAEQIARDLGVSLPDLRRLARQGPDAADLLLKRMAALDLDRNEVARVEPQTFKDLQRVCTMCGSHRRCARDLARSAADPAWESYCPNLTTLKALDAMPWASRNEW